MTGQGEQVFKNLYFKRGLYEIEVEVEGDKETYGHLVAKTRSGTPLMVYFKKSGKYLEHIKKSRFYHIAIHAPAAYSITFRLVE